MAKSKSFEDALNRLSEIVKELDSSDTKLEDSMKLFEEGVTLSKYCREVLKNAAERVELLNDEDDSEE
ncbi:MAG: exodeoxyribonuclease VII small subunit [Candidatus Marinimicrobia bacterium]|nr:exodeoxyribonuclease VII small subunit [Candidatus Neomarinimicrobiota bacterium]